LKALADTRGLNCYVHDPKDSGCLVEMGHCTEAAEQETEPVLWHDASEDLHVPCNCFTVSVHGDSPFMVHVTEKTENQKSLENLCNEIRVQCGGPAVGITFEDFVLKIVHALHDATVPCPHLHGKLDQQVKELWGLHTGAPAAQALEAPQLDFLDRVLGKDGIQRCRVCFKPCEGEVHTECQISNLRCPSCVGNPPIPARKPRGDKSHDPHNRRPPACDNSLAVTLQHMAEFLDRSDRLLGPLPRCPLCNAQGVMRTEDKPQQRPGSCKVSRKRGRSS
jgi:hypothetical protein